METHQVLETRQGRGGGPSEMKANEKVQASLNESSRDAWVV